MKTLVWFGVSVALWYRDVAVNAISDKAADRLLAPAIWSRPLRLEVIRHCHRDISSANADAVEVTLPVLSKLWENFSRISFELNGAAQLATALRDERIFELKLSLRDYASNCLLILYTPAASLGLRSDAERRIMTSLSRSFCSITTKSLCSATEASVPVLHDICGYVLSNN